MERAKMETLLRRWMAFWQAADLSTFDDLHVRAFVDRTPAGRGTDRAAFGGGIATLYEAFPDFRAVIDDMVLDEQRSTAAIRWHAIGTHRGHFMGVEPTGAEIMFRGIEIVRFDEGRVAERWGEWDGLGILEQLHAALSHAKQ